jgi:hypothetical protein
MKKLLLYGFVGFMLLAFVIGGLRSCFPLDPNEVKIEKPIVVKSYEKMTLEEKQTEIDSFARYEKYKENFALVNNTFTESAKKIVKFPETLELLFSDGEWKKPEEFILRQSNFYIDNLNEGKLTIKVDIRSENTFSQKVRNKMFLKIKFNQDKKIEFLDLGLE